MPAAVNQIHLEMNWKNWNPAATSNPAPSRKLSPFLTPIMTCMTRPGTMWSCSGHPPSGRHSSKQLVTTSNSHAWMRLSKSTCKWRGRRWRTWQSSSCTCRSSPTWWLTMNPATPSLKTMCSGMHARIRCYTHANMSQSSTGNVISFVPSGEMSSHSLSLSTNACPKHLFVNNQLKMNSSQSGMLSFSTKSGSTRSWYILPEFSPC